MSVLEVTEDTFESEVLQATKPVVVDFWATWCQPCRAISPIIDEFGENNPDVKVVKINADDNGNLVNQFVIKSIPSIMIFNDGEEVGTIVGARPKKVLLESLEAFLTGTR